MTANEPPLVTRPSSLPRPSLSMYFNAARLRTDRWHRLKGAAQQLHERSRQGGGDLTEAAQAVEEQLAALGPLEAYWAFPGPRAFAELGRLVRRQHYAALAETVSEVVRLLSTDTYRSLSHEARRRFEHVELERDASDEAAPAADAETHAKRPYFELLVVDDLSESDQAALRKRLLAMRRDEDEFDYDVVVVGSFEDALIAVLLNTNIQSCVIRFGFPFRSSNRLELIQRTLASLPANLAEGVPDTEMGILLGQAIGSLRPTLDLFLVTDAPVEEVAGDLRGGFRRVFYRQEDYLELHLSILKGIRERYETPFFTALKTYSRRPTGVFHALPISRAKSISRSHWIKDMAQFYGTNVFLAETSATTGGLDSLQQPVGPLRDAQVLAARAFGAKRSFFVTNGTTTANKIVMQALARPDDIVLVSRDCHKSHHYALVLTGAYPVYLDSYPLVDYSIYGAVPLREIKRELLALKRDGKLDRVRLLLLTNCTFDGVVYNPERVMEEVLAIKPDMIFVWDEAWFAFARFTPSSRRRTAMDAAARLRDRLRTPAYRARWEDARKAQEALDGDDEAWLDTPLLPDPDKARIRVYATQSTHKTLTSLRQGSMIHVWDQDFAQRASDAFHEAYMTHTSTSPNYQILASLDVGRRQVELEGYELVQHAIELALTLRQRINTHPLLSRYFRMLGPADLVPAAYRSSGFQTYLDVGTDWARLDQAFEDDEFCLDPTRLTLSIGRTGIDGDSFKKRLMEDHDIQINKTSRNTVLFMTHIGSTRGSAAFLIEVLTQIASELDEEREHESAMEARLREAATRSLTHELPPLPNFSRFHRAFRPLPASDTIEGDLRRAFFLSREEDNCRYAPLDAALAEAVESGQEVASASFVTPYPPGFPVLVPGQVISPGILAFLAATDVKEIHGYEPRFGLRVFTDEALRRERERRAHAVQGAPGPARPRPAKPARPEPKLPLASPGG